MYIFYEAINMSLWIVSGTYLNITGQYITMPTYQSQTKLHQLHSLRKKKCTYSVNKKWTLQHVACWSASIQLQSEKNDIGTIGYIVITFSTKKES